MLVIFSRPGAVVRPDTSVASLFPTIAYCTERMSQNINQLKATIKKKEKEPRMDEQRPKIDLKTISPDPGLKKMTTDSPT